MSPSVSPSVSISPSKSPSISPSSSPSASPSVSPSASISPSVSPSPSPGYEGYTRGDYASLPVGVLDLEVAYSAQDYLDVDTNNTVRVGQTATGQFMVHQFKDYIGNGSPVHLECDLQTTLAPGTSTVYLQIFNRNTPAWETVDTDNTSGVNTDFTLTADIADPTNYKDGNGVIACRVYQEAV